MSLTTFDLSRTISIEQISIDPLVMSILVVSILNVVVLPAPFDPRRAKHSCEFKAKFNDFTAVKFPYFLVTFLRREKIDRCRNR